MKAIHSYFAPGLLLVLQACTVDLGSWQPSDINDSGVIVGAASGPDQAVRAVRFEGAGPVVELEVFSGNSKSEAVAISNEGRIAGWSGSSSPWSVGSDSRVVLWTDSKTVGDLGQFSGLPSTVTAMNNHGVIVGIGIETTENERGLYQVAHPWIYEPATGTMSALPLPPNAVGAQPVAINDRGEIAGNAHDARNNWQVIRWAEDRSVRVVPSGSATGGAHVQGINDSGTMVGIVDRKPALWPVNSEPILLSTGEYPEGSAVAINDAGIVIGEAHYPSDTAPAYAVAVRWSATHVPEELKHLESGSTLVAINASGDIVGRNSRGAFRFR
jgi:uncharacterized membrane protein